MKNYKEIFKKAEIDLQKIGGVSVFNPAIIPDKNGWEYDDYIAVSKAMLSRCDAIFLLDNWTDSNGARSEVLFAIEKGIAIFTCLDEARTEVLRRKKIEGGLKGDRLKRLQNGKKNRKAKILTDFASKRNFI